MSSKRAGSHAKDSDQLPASCRAKGHVGLAGHCRRMALSRMAQRLQLVADGRRLWVEWRQAQVGPPQPDDLVD
jgi:hypothetical protein